MLNFNYLICMFLQLMFMYFFPVKRYIDEKVLFK